MLNPTITMLIGLPRAGKTEFIKRSLTDQIIISADQFRQIMYGQRYYMDGESFMWATREVSLKILMQQGVDIVVDETNITAANRAKLIRLAKHHGYKIAAIWIDALPDLCKCRAISTNQEDLIPIIDKMAAQFEKPEYKEGFDYISYYGADDYFMEYYEKERLAYIDKLKE